MHPPQTAPIRSSLPHAATILRRSALFAAIAVVAACALACSMPVSAATGAAPGTEAPAGRAVRALLDGTPRAALALIPADFERAAGYTPVLRDGMAVDPAGGCSSPIPVPGGFTPACRAHDLGYDLLRYADSQGTALGGWARRGLDAQLAARMRDACGGTDTACLAAADAATAAVGINSWRQGYAVPVNEDLSLYAVGGVGIAGTALAAGGALASVLRTHRRRRAASPARTGAGVPA